MRRWYGWPAGRSGPTGGGRPGTFDRLRDDYRIIAIDRLGHGESDKPNDPSDYLEPLIASDILAVMDAEQVEQALVWGHSMGASNSATLAELEPSSKAWVHPPMP